MALLVAAGIFGNCQNYRSGESPGVVGGGSAGGAAARAVALDPFEFLPDPVPELEVSANAAGRPPYRSDAVSSEEVRRIAEASERFRAGDESALAELEQISAQHPDDWRACRAWTLPVELKLDGAVATNWTRRLLDFEAAWSAVERMLPHQQRCHGVSGVLDRFVQHVLDAAGLLRPWTYGANQNVPVPPRQLTSQEWRRLFQSVSVLVAFRDRDYNAANRVFDLARALSLCPRAVRRAEEIAASVASGSIWTGCPTRFRAYRLLHDIAWQTGHPEKAQRLAREAALVCGGELIPERDVRHYHLESWRGDPPLDEDSPWARMLKEGAEEAGPILLDRADWNPGDVVVMESEGGRRPEMVCLLYRGDGWDLAAVKGGYSLSVSRNLGYRAPELAVLSRPDLFCPDGSSFAFLPRFPVREGVEVFPCLGWGLIRQEATPLEGGKVAVRLSTGRGVEWTQIWTVGRPWWDSAEWKHEREVWFGKAPIQWRELEHPTYQDDLMLQARIAPYSSEWEQALFPAGQSVAGPSGKWSGSEPPRNLNELVSIAVKDIAPGYRISVAMYRELLSVLAPYLGESERNKLRRQLAEWRERLEASGARPVRRLAGAMRALDEGRATEALALVGGEHLQELKGLQGVAGALLSARALLELKRPCEARELLHWLPFWGPLATPAAGLMYGQATLFCALSPFDHSDGSERARAFDSFRLRAIWPLEGGDELDLRTQVKAVPSADGLDLVAWNSHGFWPLQSGGTDRPIPAGRLERLLDQTVRSAARVPATLFQEAGREFLFEPDFLSAANSDGSVAWRVQLTPSNLSLECPRCSSSSIFFANSPVIVDCPGGRRIVLAACWASSIRRNSGSPNDPPDGGIVWFDSEGRVERVHRAGGCCRGLVAERRGAADVLYGVFLRSAVKHAGSPTVPQNYDLVVEAFDACSGTESWEKEVESSINGFGAGLIGVIGGAAPRLVIGGETLSILSADGGVVFRGKGYSHHAVADFNGDGLDEILVRDNAQCDEQRWCQPIILAGDGRELWRAPSRIGIPEVVEDLDGDGAAEIVASGTWPASGVFVFGMVRE